MLYLFAAALVPQSCTASLNSADYAGAEAKDLTPLPEVQWSSQRWSHYLNPWAHTGVKSYLGLSGSDGLTYGESQVDSYVLGDWAGSPPTSVWDTPWSSKEWVVRVAGIPRFIYKRRNVTLPSGTGMTIFRPTAPPAVTAPNWAGFQRDALFFADSYQVALEGSDHVLGKVPPAFLATGSPSLDYTGTPCPYGWEIEEFPSGSGPSTYFPDANVRWIRPGTPEYEALELGMTLVYVTPSIGGRPPYHHLVSLIEAAQWLDSSDYETIPVRHRNIVTGASAEGTVAALAATYLPWIFRGAIPYAPQGIPDSHMQPGWYLPLELLQRQLLGHYANADLCEWTDPAGLTYFEAGKRGYTPGGASILPQAVDLAGWGLFASELGAVEAQELFVPITIYAGDEDQSCFWFFGEDIEAIPTGTNTGSTGSILVRRIPAQNHEGGVVEREWYRDNPLLSEMLTRVDMNAPLTPESSLRWAVRAPAGSPTPHTGTRLRDALTKRRSAEGPAGSGVTATQVAGDWTQLQVAEGLGASGTLVLSSVLGVNSLLAGTARGEVVRIDIPLNVDPSAPLIPEWSVRVGDYIGPVSVAAHPTGAIVCPTWGPIVHVKPNMDTTVVVNNDALTTDDYNLGTTLRNLRRIGNQSAYILTNDEGELIELQVSQSATPVTLHLNKGFVEGGLGPVLPPSSFSPGTSTYIYGSPHGNIKRTSRVDSDPAHPFNVADISRHFSSRAEVLLELPSEVNDVRYIAVTTSEKLILLSALLESDRTFSPGTFATPDRSIDLPLDIIVDETGPGVVKFLARYPSLPSGLCEVRGYELTIPPPPGHATLTRKEYVVLPGLATAMTRAPAGQTAGGMSAEWIVTLQSGQLAFVADLSSGTMADVSATKLKVWGSPFGSAFGLVAQSPNKLFIVGPNDSAFEIPDVFAPIAFVTKDNGYSFQGTNRPFQPPFHGAVVVGNEPYGLPDGGALFPGTPYVGMPYSYHDPADSELDRAGYILVKIDKYISNIPLAQRCFSELYSGPGLLWRSEDVMAPNSVCTVTSQSLATSGFGNNCVWANLDGVGGRDLVGGTYGGSVMWWRNTGIASAPLTATRTGTLNVPYNVGSKGGLGANAWRPDLGASIIAMAGGNLNDDSAGVDEIIIGTGFDADPDHAEQFMLENGECGGSLYVIGKNTANDNLVVLSKFPAFPGGTEFFGDGLSHKTLGFVCGVHHFEIGVRDIVVAGTADGYLHIFEYNHTASPRFNYLYRSKYFAPMVGAYNSIVSFQSSTTTRRVVFSTAGGLYALDVQF